MSLINQVLRDLDQRHVTSRGAAFSVRATPFASESTGLFIRRMLMGMSAFALVLAAGWMSRGLLGRSFAAPAVSSLESSATTGKPVVVATSSQAPAVQATERAFPQKSAKPAPELSRESAKKASKPSKALPTLASTAPVDFIPSDDTVSIASLNLPIPQLRVPLMSAGLAVAAPLDNHIRKSIPASTAKERAEARYQQGLILHQQGQNIQATEEFSASLREVPGFVLARQALAGLLVSQGQFDDAQVLLRAGFAVSANQPALALMLAQMQTDRHDLPGAIETLKAAMPLAAQNADFLGFYAAALQRAGQHPEAAEQFNAALQLRPGQSVWWMGLGLSMMANGQMDKAREAFQRAKQTGALSAELASYVDQQLRKLM